MLLIWLRPHKVCHSHCAVKCIYAPAAQLTRNGLSLIGLNVPHPCMGSMWPATALHVQKGHALGCHLGSAKHWVLCGWP